MKYFFSQPNGATIPDKSRFTVLSSPRSTGSDGPEVFIQSTNLVTPLHHSFLPLFLFLTLFDTLTLSSSGNQGFCKR